MEKKKYSRVYVEITNICNRNCSFCPGTVRKKHKMTLSDFASVAESLRGVTDYIYLHVMGEPLTHPDLRGIIECATEKGFKCAITTNGSLLNERRNDIIGSGLYKMNVSVHSFEDGEESDHLAYLSSICDFATAACESGILVVLRLWNRGAEDTLNDRTLEFLKSKLQGEWKWGSRGARLRHKLHLEYGDRFEWPDMEAEDMGDSVFCYGLRDHFGILSDGRVIPCCLDREGEITLGNILDTPIEQILASERAEKMLRGFDCRRASEELCRKCGYARRFG